MRRDRHGRGLRGPLAPRALPISKTSSERFDALVMDIVASMERRLGESMGPDHGSLRHIEFAVGDVPPQVHAYDADIVEDKGVPLARLYPAQPGTIADAPRIVLYRRPIELRATSDDERETLVRSVLAEQLSSLLNIPPDDLEG